MATLVNIEQLTPLRAKAVVLHAIAGGQRPKEGIPGAYIADLGADFSDLSAPLPLTVPANIQEIFQNYGISTDTPVVVYDDLGGGPAARIWWLGMVAGLTNIAILNGGLGAWVDSGRNLGELKTLETAMPRTGKIKAAAQWERLCDADGVREALQEHNSFVIDVRPEALYTGAVTAAPHLHAGHIPGSYNLPTAAFINNGYFRDSDEIRDILEEIVGPAGAITFTCGVAMMACVGAAAAHLAGYGNVQVYEGSWAEWGHIAQDPTDFPIATGIEEGSLEDNI
ncbi:sulfurtransferase [Corynebacterium caspium]|uniref:sulfurtransferase n=1 Tax=Corynebacterium caspium TaxID=234828 RepID=UPI00036DF77E|nr:rhodanese-like domain-containing protein [Corynebacterium caspium]WKD59344.1 3-mercaptopyruvate sulfurtransferase [Corynebacterium caspium DSM 44850]